MEKVKDKIKEQIEKKQKKEVAKEKAKLRQEYKKIIKEATKEQKKELNVAAEPVATKKLDKNKVYKGRVICDRLAVRYKPDENAMLKRCEYKYTIIYLQDENSDFYKVFNEYDAYLMKKYIKILDE